VLYRKDGVTMADLIRKYESAITLRDDVVMYYRAQIPKGMKALVIFVHGVCEHSGRYAHLAEKMLDAGFGVIRLDLRGHGRSGGIRGYVSSYHEYSDDLSELIKQLRKEFTQEPFYMLGHSMGALISVLYELAYPGTLKGQILSGLPATELPLPSIKLLKKLPYEKFPKIRVANDLGKLVSRDPEVISDYQKDPMNLKKQTIKMSAEMFIKAPEYIMDHVWEYTLPCLILHGEGDRIVDPASSLWFSEHIMSEDKARIVYPKLYHEIFNEKEKDDVIADAIAWLEDRYYKVETVEE
jgi:acylglycerol lipase